jgi:hypothetical protein
MGEEIAIVVFGAILVAVFFAVPLFAISAWMRSRQFDSLARRLWVLEAEVARLSQAAARPANTRAEAESAAAKSADASPSSKSLADGAPSISPFSPEGSAAVG